MAAASPRPPAAAAWRRQDWNSRALVQLCTIVQKENARGTKTFVCMIVQSVSARGGSCDQGWQNAYNSGLPFGAFF